MSIEIFDLGEKSEAASLFKLCSNFMILGFLSFFPKPRPCLKREVYRRKKQQRFGATRLFDCPLFKSYIPLLVSQNFEKGGFALHLGLKDMRLLQQCADAAQVPLPFLSELHEKLLTSIKSGAKNLTGLPSPS